MIDVIAEKRHNLNAVFYYILQMRIGFHRSTYKLLKVDHIAHTVILFNMFGRYLKQTY